jgi:2-polyprenyl-3-methyl-5-hydroxy-6-metoxy-1,4-benzoquinol methylase
MTNGISACIYCSASAAIRQVCDEKYVSDGVPFSCGRCGGAFFRRTLSSANSDEYWEGDLVNEQVYALEEVRRAFAKKYAWYLTRLDHIPGLVKNLLEVGCGSGIFLEVAAKRGWKVHGLDISQQAVELARKNCPTAQVICAPIERAGFLRETFNVIALWDVIEHVEDPEKLLQEARSLLASGGYLIMETPDEGCLARQLVRFAHKATAGRVSFLRALYYPAHRWYFSRRAMATVLRRVGFDQIRFYREQTVSEFGQRKVKAYGALQNWPYRIATVIMQLLPLLHNKMVVVAQKS